MDARHNSRDASFRSPFGAVRLGTTVDLAVEVWDRPRATCTCRVWVDGEGEHLYPMQAQPCGDHLRFTCSVTCDEQVVFWYSFIIEEPHAQTVYLGAQPGTVGGEGVLCDHMPPSFQITCYKPRPVQPEWYNRGIVYQIFPDRYRRGAGWEKQVAAAMELHKNGPRRRFIEDWYKPAYYERGDDGSVLTWDFYGGTLSGIKEDLPRLAEMGVTSLYLNPIFEAESNHRYDTGDYLEIDPMLGDEESFRELCGEAAAWGISVILDGVFNHTGSDSRYFNQLGNYDSVGAWQSEDSPYRDWFSFSDDGAHYDSWWGVAALPAVNENNPTFQKFITGEGGVVEKWLRAGARGWRLDVADELPDDFIEKIKARATDVKEDALVLGEVWEDASNKTAYGKLRRYLLGDELDAAMNYPFRDAVLGFLTGAVTAQDVEESMESLRENYPREALYNSLNLIGSHDRQRILTVLGDAPAENSFFSEKERGEYRLPGDKLQLAKSRFWLAVLLQMTMAGVPCIYYGDEAGMQGFSDPCNRGPYPWGREDRDTMTMYRNAISVRRELPFLVDGDIRFFSQGRDVFGFWRFGDNMGSERLAVCVNRSTTRPRRVQLPMHGAMALDLVSGAELAPDEEGNVTLTLWPLGAALVYFREGQPRYARQLERGSGVVCHITSVPNHGKPGTLGAPARRFVDFLAPAHQRYWQVLPVNPVDAYGSPYAGVSAFAGNEALLEEDEKTLRASFKAFAPDAAYHTFVLKNADWLLPYAAFMAIRDAQGGADWHEWPEEFQHYDRDLLEDPRFIEAARFHMFCQFRFDVEWRDLRSYAHVRGIEIIGDMPMYVSADSVDVWAHPELFNVDETGTPVEVAGTPPDAFAAQGQVWGNPTYRWAEHKRTGYAWWTARLARMMELYDWTRFDHFLGLESYYSIPLGKPASEGRWIPGPGLELFERARRRLGPLPLIAEDLGTITPAVRALVARTGFAGMDVALFADYDVREGYRAHPGKIAYTSTHDTQTLVGWCTGSFGTGDGAEIAEKIKRSVIASDAVVAMMPLQDVLGLTDDARMNVPGVAAGNWSWQATEDQLEPPEVARSLASLTDLAGRTVKQPPLLSALIERAQGAPETRLARV